MLGSISATQFSRSRGDQLIMTVLQVSLTSNTPCTVIQELGREGILPFSSVVASNRPFNAPLVALITLHCVSCIFLFALPPGDAYLFLLSCKSGIFCLETILRIARQCRLVHCLLSMPWFRLACSSYTCRHIGLGTGTLHFELLRLSSTHFSYLTCFWSLCHSFPLLPGQRFTRNFPTGYVMNISTLC